MKLFGHYIPQPAVALVVLDAATCLGGLKWLPNLQACAACQDPPVAGVPPLDGLLLAGGFVFAATALGLYNREAWKDLAAVAGRFALAALPLLTLGALGLLMLVDGDGSGGFASRAGPFALASAVFVLLVFGLHLVIAGCCRLPFLRRRIVVLGTGPEAEAIAAFLEGPARSHFRLVKTVSSWSAPAAPARFGNLALKAAAQPLALLAPGDERKADEIVVAVDDRRSLPVAELLDCKLSGVEVIDALTFWERETGRIDPENVSLSWLALNGGFALTPRRRLLKRAADIVVSLVFLLAILPLALLTALAVRLESRGPIFYGQDRVGLDGRVFKVWKFRSMRVDAESDGVPQWARTNDDRVTRVGRVIRKIRVDEIPQVLNVVIGDMSFIGPRPERPFFVDQLSQSVPYYDLRHRVRPGITGWAQVNYPYGGSMEDAQRKLAYDLYYLKKNDLLLDLAILLQTVRVVLFAHGGR